MSTNLFADGTPGDFATRKATKIKVKNFTDFFQAASPPTVQNAIEQLASPPTTFTGSYLKLDASNDPLTGTLNGVDATFTGTGTFDKLTLTNTTIGVFDITTNNPYCTLYFDTAEDSEFLIDGPAGGDAGIGVYADYGGFSPNFSMIAEYGAGAKFVSDSALTFYVSSDNNDGIIFQVIDDIPELTTVGDCDLKISPDGGDTIIVGDVGIADTNPNLSLRVTEDDSAFELHANKDGENDPWGVLQLWKGTDTDGQSFTVDGDPLMYFDNDNDVYFPLGNVEANGQFKSVDGNATALFRGWSLSANYPRAVFEIGNSGQTMNNVWLTIYPDANDIPGGISYTTSKPNDDDNEVGIHLFANNSTDKAVIGTSYNDTFSVNAPPIYIAPGDFEAGTNWAVKYDTDNSTLFNGDVTIISGKKLVVDTTTLVVNASGYVDKVGIGVNSPDEKLEVAGSVSLGTSASSTNRNRGLLLYNTTNGYDYGIELGYDNSRYNVRAMTNTGGDFTYATYTAGSEPDTQSDYTTRFLINGSTGNVGIGTAAPGSLLDVRGTVTVGIDDTGYDVKFYGATAGDFFLWDESDDELDLSTAKGLVIPSGATNTGQAVDGSLFLDTDLGGANGTLQIYSNGAWRTVTDLNL